MVENNTVLSEFWQGFFRVKSFSELLQLVNGDTARFKRLVGLIAMFDEYNESLGNALTVLPEQNKVFGRDKEIDMLYAVLERPNTPVALLLGQAGVGKTALVEEFVRRLNSGEYETKLNNEYMMLSLRLGNLASLGNHKLQSALSQLLNQLYDFETALSSLLGKPNLRLVLFIDEIHVLVTIFGPGTKIGGDIIKDVLARAPIRIIGATTRREYDSTIAVDKPLAERFKAIEMQELPVRVVKDICLRWWDNVASDSPKPSDEVLDLILEANAMYRSDSAEPRKSLDILEDLVSYCRRTGLPAKREQLSEIFKNRYSINLDFLVDADVVYGELERRIKGQPYALAVLRKMLRSMIYRLDTVSNKPMATALLTGPTGVGKTETVKAIAHSLYPNEPVTFFMNMPDYYLEENEPLFRKRLGEFVRHTPNAIVLLDEFEKAGNLVQDSMLSILDEGIVRFDTINREGLVEPQEVSLKNSIIFATTNAGAEVFSNDARFSQRGDSDLGVENSLVLNAEVQQLYKSLLDFLQSAGFKPEMLGRFSRIVPYRGLSAETLLRITERKLAELHKKFLDTQNIKISFSPPKQWDKDVYDYTTTDVALYITFVKAKADDPSAGGARSIDREIQSNVYDAIIECIYENKTCKHFHVTISDDAPIYKYGASASEGGVVVEPVYA